MFLSHCRDMQDDFKTVAETKLRNLQNWRTEALRILEVSKQ